MFVNYTISLFSFCTKSVEQCVWLWSMAILHSGMSLVLGYVAISRVMHSWSVFKCVRCFSCEGVFIGCRLFCIEQVFTVEKSYSQTSGVYPSLFICFTLARFLSNTAHPVWKMMLFSLCIVCTFQLATPMSVSLVSCRLRLPCT